MKHHMTWTLAGVTVSSPRTSLVLQRFFVVVVFVFLKAVVSGVRQ